MPFPPIKTISYPPRFNHSPLEGESNCHRQFGEGSENQITTSILHNDSLTPHEASKLASAPPQGGSDADRELQRRSDADRPRFNHPPLEGESNCHRQFGEGSKDQTTNSNSSFVNSIYPSPKASPSNTPVKREGDADRELHRGERCRSRTAQGERCRSS